MRCIALLVLVGLAALTLPTEARANHWRYPSSSYYAPVQSSYYAPIRSSYYAPIQSNYYVPYRSAYYPGGASVAPYYQPRVTSTPPISSYTAPLPTYTAPTIRYYYVPSSNPTTPGGYYAPFPR